MNSVLRVLQVLTAGALFALPLANVQGLTREPAPANEANSYAIEMLTPTQGVDFSVYLTHLAQVVRRNWYATIPESARLGDKGKVVLRVRIQKDGTLLAQTPTVEVSSGKKSLDKAAVAAIRSSAPFDHLPEAFHGPNIELRITFLYNLPPALHRGTP
jgi:TonB family protein